MSKNKTDSNLFQIGFNLHQSGQIALAKKIYEQVVSQESRHFDAWHLLGVVAIQSNNLVAASASIQKAISINPINPFAYFNLGCALHGLNQLEKLQ